MKQVYPPKGLDFQCSHSVRILASFPSRDAEDNTDDPENLPLGESRHYKGPSGSTDVTSDSRQVRRGRGAARAVGGVGVRERAANGCSFL
jgi:hypothetical protein